MSSRKAYAWLLNHNKETSYLDSVQSLLNWDQRTHIPPRGHAHRAAQLATLARFVHIRMTDPKMGEMLAAVESSEWMKDPLSAEAVNIREWRRSYDRATKIPERLAVELARASAEGETAWEEARPRNDWAAFKPFLARLVALKREEAGALTSGGELYDALLDAYEPGETAQNIAPVFTRLREALVEILHRIEGGSRRPDTSILQLAFPVSLQQTFACEVLERLGYDFQAGRIDPTAHPFSVGIGPGDVRITTRYDERSFSMALFGAIHEAGHALYEQGLPEEHWGAPMGQAVSLGIHESQSRMWENLVGRSFGFWKYFYPQAQKHFPFLNEIPLEAFHFAINTVSPSLIRTEADEVTYNLHVLLRFELELALMRNELEVADLPEAWKDGMQAYLGLTPPDYAQGVMQDVHWSGGAIGYFPTYTLGNLYAAQFYAQAEKELGDPEALFARGEFAPFLAWLRNKIHGEGSRYRPRDLVKAVTGEGLKPEVLIEYLMKKFGALYGF